MQGCVHIVDDDVSFARAMERRLKHAGYEVATYASAQHLLDRLPSEELAARILLTCAIPGQTVRHWRRRLSQLGSTLPYQYSSLAIPTSRPRCGPSRRARMTF